MNVLEKAEKALNYLKNVEGSAKNHELQAAAGTLGRCLAVLGSRPNCAKHYANLLHSAMPTLLALASNDSAEIRLLGDEALNRAVVGGFAFHSYKTNIILQNQIDSTKNARWIRAALSRICLGDCWLRPGVGKIRNQAQTLFPKLSQIIRQTNDVQLIVEALEANIQRLLVALAEYTTDEEISELSKALLSHVETVEPPIRRAVSTCVARLVDHRDPLLTNLLSKIFEKLWPLSTDNAVILGWFSVIKAIFQINNISKFQENDLFGVQDYMELYYLCLHYLDNTTNEHNLQNTIMECLSVLLSQARGSYRKALLDSHPKPINLDERTCKGHKRNISSASAISTRYIPSPLVETKDHPELKLSGALQLGSILQLHSSASSQEDLSIQTPDSPASDTDVELPSTEQLTQRLAEKLEKFENLDPVEHVETDQDHVDTAARGSYIQINIGSLTDDDIPLKYCARLLASKFLLTGNKGRLISDRSMRVSVKASALNCISEILQLYPQAMTMYVDRDAQIKCHNVSGSSEGTDSQDQINEFILERNVCYQDSLTDSLSQDLLNRSMDSQQTSNENQVSKKDSRSLEKSQDSVEQKSSSKDVPSAILDSKKDLATSGLTAMTDSTNPNMTNSNFTTNSNMTGSNTNLTASNTGYPMTSSGDVLSSSIDLDIKFDHFGESTTNLDNLKDLERPKRPLKRTDEVHSKDAPDGFEKDVRSMTEFEKEIAEVQKSEDGEEKIDSEKDFEFQHMSDIFVLLENHNDPQIRGLVRVCIGCYLSAALDLSHGDYHRWKNFTALPKDVSDNICTEKLVNIVFKGLTDEIHSAVNHTLSSLTTLSPYLCSSAHWNLLVDVLNSVRTVENNSYWLCRVNLCRFYAKLPYKKLFILYPGYHMQSKLIMDTLFRLLGDQDQKVRHAAAQTIAEIIPKIYPSKTYTPTTMLADVVAEHSSHLDFEHKGLSLDLVKQMYFYYDVPEQLSDKAVTSQCCNDSLRKVVSQLTISLYEASDRNYSQGLLETLQAVCLKWPPWSYKKAYTGLDLLGLCLDILEHCNESVAVRTIMMDICRLIYPVEIHNIMCHKTTNRDIFERDSNTKVKWQHLNCDRTSQLAEKFLQVTLKMLNVLVHLIEEVNPSVHLNKGIALPGSPVRRKTQDTSQRKSSIPSEQDEKASLRKKAIPAVGLKGNLAGHFFNEPFYMKLYETLRATYSNHKINLDPKSSMFLEFLNTTLKCLAIQLELATENEFGAVTEEILYYLRVIMPLKPDTAVHCVTQLLKCLFSTNMINQYNDFMSISNRKEPGKSSSFFGVLLANPLICKSEEKIDSRRSSISSNNSQKMSLDTKNPKMLEERQLLITMENFAKNRMDRKWSTNKKELERYIRLFEPVVIQALKSYTMQNDTALQRAGLCLLHQLLSLRVNYCMLDSEQVFIGFLMRQLDLAERQEIPNCCELVNSIMMFLVQLSSSKHHTKQIIEIPKLIQLCDGLMAAGAHAECIAGLEPVAVKVFSNMGGSSVLGRAQQQEVQATREVLFYMLQKTMHQHKVLDLVSCVLCLSQEHPESYYRWSELASDTLLNLLSQRSIEIDTFGSISSLERLLDSIYRDVLLQQNRVEMMLKILFKSPPDQATTPYKLKLRYLSIVMVLLRKLLILVPENEILLTINYLKSSFISPQSIFFNIKNDIDPLNVQNVNENCANLSPDVILVRFLFKTLTYAILEMDNCHEASCMNLDLQDDGNMAENHRLLYAVCVNIIVQVKNILHLTGGCLFPLTAKTAQTILHNEQSGLNTGLYSPEENIPLDLLNLICLRSAHRAPLLTVHWSHLLIRLNFLTHKYWQKLVGFARNLPLSAARGDAHLLKSDVLQTACVMAYCEYFVENGLSEVVHLTWLLVNRVHILVSQYQREEEVQRLICKVQELAGASGLLLQAVAARCQGVLKDEFALNTYKILSQCHDSQSGALVFLICRIIGKLEPAIAVRFAKLAIERCQMLKEMSIDQINVQLSKEDLQVALELVQRDKVHIRYPKLVEELNSLASSVFDLSPLDLSQDRAINPQYIITTKVDGTWLLNQVKSRCCQTDDTSRKLSNQNELALLLSNLSREDLITVMKCPEFDRKLLCSCFKVSCDSYLREFVAIVGVHEAKEMERDSLVKQTGIKDMTSSIDSNKLNVLNTVHVFKKSDNKESKSQFFIPISDNNEKNNFGNLRITEESTELIPPEFPELYKVSVDTFDKILSDVIRLFPKQNRPLSQSENFNLNVEQTIDRYTRRCHQVFQDKVFYKEFITIQTILTGFLNSLDRLISSIDEADCDLLEKCIENILPLSLAKNIAIFSVISLQYLSFIIKNKKLVESPIHADVSFRVTESVTEDIVVDHVVSVTLSNVADALDFDEIWTDLNVDSNVNRTQSAVSCLYAIVKYLVKDTKPLRQKQYIQLRDQGSRPDLVIVGDKLINLVEYWEENFYLTNSGVLGKCYKEPLESLIVSLARLELFSNIALVPPIAWSSVEVSAKKDQVGRIDLPLQALQDQDVLEAFLFRANLIGWSSKKQFEEMWVGVLGALQGNGPQSAVQGIAQLIASAAPRVRRRKALHLPRGIYACNSGIQRLRSLLVGTKAYSLFDNVNLERIPLAKDDFDGYHYAQFNTDYLKLASDIVDDAPYHVRKEVKRLKKNKDIDINSCLQLLMDITAQMLDPKADTGVACAVSLLRCMVYCSEQYSQPGQWCCAAQTLISLCGEAHARLAQYNCTGRALLHALSRCVAVLEGFDGLQELSTVHQKLVKSLSSSYAPLRQAALHGCLRLLSGRENVSQDLVTQLALAVRQNLGNGVRISLYEQSLYWAVLFSLIELGHPDLISLAVEFLLSNPTHYCTDLVVKGITTTIRQQMLPKELKNSVIENLLDNMRNYDEDHAIQILMVHLFSADDKLLSPKLTSDVSNMDPDVLMNSMERITLLYKCLRQCKSLQNKRIVATAMKYFLRETLPPAATLSRVVIEFLEICKETEKKMYGVLSDRRRQVQSSVLNAEIVFEVFETSISQDQLPVLSGWIFEALCHLLHGKISSSLLPYCLLTLLISASSNNFLRKLHPLSFSILRLGLCRILEKDESLGFFKEFLNEKSAMSFSDKRLLCVTSLHSGFNGNQLERLKELCDSDGALNDLMQCLNQ